MLDIELGSAQRIENLVVLPLISAGPAELECDLLADALAAGTVVVGEVGEGSVPTLRVENSGARDVLVLDGEQLIGARQNRTTNRSIVLGAKEITQIPVSCMEQGRWQFEEKHFKSSQDHSPAKVRRKAREMEGAAVQAHQAAAPSVLADAQGAVWEEIGDLSYKLGVDSSTGALDKAYTERRQQIEAWVDGVEAVDGQVGLLVLTPEGPLGMDVVGSNRLYAKLHCRLLRGVLMDGLERGIVGGGEEPAYRFTEADVAPAVDGDWPQKASRRFLGWIGGAKRTEAPTVGLGSYRVLTGQVVGGELVHGGRLAHLSAYPVRKGRGRRRG